MIDESEEYGANIRLEVVDRLEIQHRVGLRDLWNNEYPARLTLPTQQDMNRYLDGMHHPHHILVFDDDRMVGWSVDLDRDGERWFAVIMHRAYHGHGLGRRLVSGIQSRHDMLSGWVIDHSDEIRADGTSYPSPLVFYTRLGFVVCPDIRLETPQLSAVKIQWKKSARP